MTTTPIPLEFSPSFHPSHLLLHQQQPSQSTNNNESGVGVGFFQSLFGKKKKNAISPRHDHSIPALKQRKAPIKVEPKVFFANERTFLAWMHVSIIMAGASIAILAFTDESGGVGGQIYGIVMLPVAVAFIVYAMYQCKYEKERFQDVV